MIRTLNSTRSMAARAARHPAAAVVVVLPRRTFIRPTAALQADFVQDLYLKELKSYKAPASKANDHAGHVHEFSAPKTPKSPEESNIADELQAYESQQVEVEGQAAPGEASAVEEDWFEEPEEEHEGKAAH